MTADELAAILTAEPAPGHPVWARFDSDFYRATNPTLGIRPGADPAATALRHYLQVGRFTGRSPNAWFDEAWYRARNAGVEELLARGTGGIESGFEHYLLAGHALFSPHWLFDEAIYRNDVSDHAIAATGSANAYDHYLRSGARRGLAAHPRFDAAFYRAVSAIAAEDLPTTGAFGHYLERLWREGREGWTTPGFDLIAARRDPAAITAIAERHALGALHWAMEHTHPHTIPAGLAQSLRKAWETSEPSPGGLDLIGIHEAAGGRFIAGWLGHGVGAPDGPALNPEAPALIALHHNRGVTATRAELALFPRDDLGGKGQGFLAFVAAAEGTPTGTITRIDVIGPNASWRLAVPPNLPATPRRAPGDRA